MIAKNYDEKNKVFGLTQAEFTPMPAHLSPYGDVVVKFQLTPREKKEVLKTREIFIERTTNGDRMQPIVDSVLQPVIYEDGKNIYHSKTLISSLPDPHTKKAVVKLKLSDEEIKQIELTDCIWITTFTYGNPLHVFTLTPLKMR